MPVVHVAIVAALLSAASAQAQTLIGGGRNAPTYPIVLSEPGHYRLAANLVVPAGVSAIRIQANGVVLDLNGYSITGPNRCAPHPGGPGVLCTMADTHVPGIDATAGGAVVRNGVVRGFAGDGVRIQHGRVEALVVSENTRHGVVALGSLANAIHSRLNAQNGVAAADSTLRDVVARGNQFGVHLSGASLLTGGALHDNAQWAVWGYATSGVRATVMSSPGASHIAGVTSLGHNLCSGLAC